MRAKWTWLAILMLVTTARLPAQETLWDRRDLNTATMFRDYRARKIGDVLTVVIEETTDFNAREKRNMDKGSSHSLNTSVQGTTSGTAMQQVLQSLGFTLTTQMQHDRGFNGSNDSSIDRKFLDRMSFIVVDVLPNGNLVVEGCRQRVISREVRLLRLRGIVRPADIGPYNTLQSQFIANLTFAYEGRGPESSFTNQGWGGRLFNRLWPF